MDRFFDLICRAFDRLSAVWRFTLFIALCALVWLNASETSAATLPAGFSETVIPGPLSGGWGEAVGMLFEDTGRMYVWERAGRVWFKETNSSTFTTLIDIREEVGAFVDYGLLGVALDPNFRQNGYIYLLYVVDRHHLLYYGTPNYNPAANEYNAATIGRLTRYTCRSTDGFRSVDPASRFVMIGETKETGFPLTTDTHGVGTVLFGEDGTLLVSCGEGASAWGPDWGGPVNNGYSPQALADGIIKPKEDVGAFRAQLVDSLSGKVLRIDPATGNGIPTNPFYDPANPRAPRSRVWAMGFRNPYRMVLRPESGSHNPADGRPGILYVGDVGWNMWESLKIVTGPRLNFGWPIYEGLALTDYESPSVAVLNRDAPNPLYPATGCRQYFTFRELLKEDSLDPAAQPPFANPCNTSQRIPTTIPQFLHARPVLDWSHTTATTRTPTYGAAGQALMANVGAPGSPVSGSQFKGICSVAGGFYEANVFPPQYQNTYFHADWGEGLIKNIVMDANDKPVALRDFATAAGYVVSIVPHPTDGSLYYISYDYTSAAVRKIAYTGNRTPVAVASGDKSYGASPVTVQFSSNGSSDPDGQPITYSWNFGDGSPVSTLANPSHTFSAPAGVPTSYTVTLTVTDSLGLSAQTSLRISVNNTPPNVAITSPTDGSLYSPYFQTPINLTANVLDVESSDAQLQYEWRIILHHNEHNHASPPDTNHTASALLSPTGCDGINIYYYRILLTVTDPYGLATTHEIRMYPDCGPNTAPSISAFANQTIAEDTPTAPLSFTVSDREMAPDFLSLNGTSSDSGLVPPGNFAFGGSGSNRTVTITPAANQSGTATITLSVSDGQFTTSTNFTLTVNAVNDPPTLNPLADLTLATNPGPQVVALNGIGSGAANENQTLTVTASSSNPALIATPVVNYTSPNTSGTLTFTSAPDASGTATITVTVNDNQPAQNTFSRSFTVRVGGPPLIYLEAESGTIAAPMVVGTRADANNGQYVYSPNNNQGTATYQINIPEAGTYVVWCRTIGETDASDSFFVSVDGGAEAIYDVALAGVSPNWRWVKLNGRNLADPRLLTFTQGSHTMVFRGRDSLTEFDAMYLTTDLAFVPPASPVNTAPSISNIADQSTTAGAPTPPISFTVTDAETPAGNLTVSGTSSNITLVPNGNIVFGGSGSNRTLTVTPAAGQSGTATITVIVSDGALSASDTFVLTVTPGSNTAPTITAIGNQTINEDTSTGPLNFTIGDAESAAANLGVSAGSSNLGLVPLSNIVFGGSGANRTVTATPAANQSGSATITVTVTDGQLAANSTFLVTVNPINDPPTISNISDQTVNVSTATSPLAFTIADFETAAASLTVTAASSNLTLVPLANIAFGGSGANRTVTVTPASGQTGTSLITVTVSDGIASASDTFLLTVSSLATGTQSVTNSARITIADVGASTPYPSLINVSGLGGTISQVTVSLNGFAHTWPNDVDVLLLGPAGQKVMLMSDAGGGNPVTARNFTFSDSAAAGLPQSAALASGTFKPTDFEPGDVFPAPINASPYATNLSAFNGTNPNGTWSLYVADDGPGDSGSLATGWSLRITTSGPASAPPTISDIVNQSTTVSTPTPAIPFTIGDADTAAGSLTVSGNSANQTLVPNGNIIFGGSGSNRTVTITPAAGQSGTATITVTVSDGTNTASDSFVLTVNPPSNTPPTISAIANQTINEDGSTGPLSFTVGDLETAAAALTLSGNSSNLALVPNSNIVFGGTGANRTVTITPAADQSGATTISVIVSDGQATTSMSFVLSVTPVNDPPSISAISDQTIGVGGSTLPLSFTVADIETPVADLSLSADSSNPSLVPPGNIVLGGTGANRTVTVTAAAGQVGTATIAVTVSDGGSSATETFVVTVSEVLAQSFSNTTPIAIANVGGATPYPSTIEVSNLAGRIIEVTVNLNGFAHAWPADVDVLLVGPSGQKIVVMSDVGGGTAVSGVELTLSDAATDYLPETTPLVSGTFKPTDFEAGDAFPAPAPAGTAATTLSAFNGLNADGTWSLYVNDDGPGDDGSFDGGWTLNIRTATTPQTPNVTWPNPAAITYGTPLSTTQLNATADVPGTFAYTPPVGRVLAAGNGQTLSVTFTPADAAAYETVTSTASINVLPAPLSITADDKARRVGAPNPPLTASYSGFVNGDTPANLDTPVSLSTMATPQSPIGTYEIVASGATASNYVITHINGALTVSPQDPPSLLLSTNVLHYTEGNGAVLLDPLATLTDSDSTDFEAGNVTVTFTDSSADEDRLSLRSQGTGPGQIDVSGDEVSYQGVVIGSVTGGFDGTTPLVVAFNANATPAAAQAVLRSVTYENVSSMPSTLQRVVEVTATDGDGGTSAPRNITIMVTGVPEFPALSWTSPAPITYGTALTSTQLNATASVPGTFVYTPASGTLLAAGNGQPLSVAFTPNDAVNYLSATQTVSIDVLKRQLIVTAADKSKLYGSPNPALTVTYSGFVNGDTPSSLSTPVSVSTTATTASPEGTYPIIPSGATAANYTISFVNGTLTVTRAPLTIIADDKSRMFGQSNPPLTARYVGFVNGDTPASLATPVSLTTTATVSSVVGSYPIVASGASALNYNITHVNGLLTVTAAPPANVTVSFTNRNAINIPSVGTATPYPSVINVSNVNGSVGQVVVRLNAFRQTWPNDVDVLLVGPSGQKVIIMSDVGGGVPVTGINLTLADSATAALPRSSALTSGTFKPTDFEPGDTFPAPVVAGPYSTNLAAFNGLDPNGTWSLYVIDDGPGDLGSFASGWSLTITTVGPASAPPTISDIADQSTSANTPTAAIPFSVSDADTALTSLVLTGISSNQIVVPNANIVFGGSGANRTVTITPAAGQSGLVPITISVSDGVTTVSDSFLLSVLVPNNTPPTISTIANQTVTEDTGTGALSFTIGDAETSAASLTLSRGSSNPTLIPTNNIVLGGSGANRTVTVTPATNQNGTGTITLSVSDGQANTSTSFAVTVTAVNDLPTISNISDQTNGIDRTTGPLAFTIGDVETPASGLTVSGDSSNPTLIPLTNIVFGGSGANRTVTIVPATGQTGTSTITVTVSDGLNTASDTFVLTISSIVSITQSFTNAAAITIPDVGAAVPYPSTINVAGLAGTITQVVARLNGFAQTYPADVDALLVGPGGQKVMLMSDAGAGISVSGINLTLSDGAAGLLPQGALVSGTYKPTDYEVGDPFPAPAPAGPYGSSLAVFNGLSANGIWSLFAVDDGAGDQGSIAAGWSLTITTTASSTSAVPTDANAIHHPTLYITHSADAAVEIVVSAEPGEECQIEASTDLITWKPLGTVQSETGISSFVDLAAPSRTQLFYRAAKIP